MHARMETPPACGAACTIRARSPSATQSARKSRRMWTETRCDGYTALLPLWIGIERMRTNRATGWEEAMKRHSRTIGSAIVLAVMCDGLLAQGPTTELVIDIENVVLYASDLSDTTKFARNANITPSISLGSSPTQTPNFMLTTNIGDIVRVNGQPAKGLFASRARGMVRRLAPLQDARSPMCDEQPCVRTSSRSSSSMGPYRLHHDLWIQWSRLLRLASLRAKAEIGQSWVEPEHSLARADRRKRRAAGTSQAGAASMAEDPAFRRMNGGGTRRFVLHIIPTRRRSHRPLAPGWHWSTPATSCR